MKYIKMFIVFVLSAIMFQPVFGAENLIIIDADNQFEYAGKCFDETDYISAIVEYKRFINYFPNDLRCIEAEYKIGMAWFNGGKYADALLVFTKIITDYMKHPLVTEAWFMAAKCQVRANNPVAAEIHLRNLVKISADEGVKDRAQSTIGWIRLEAGKWGKSLASFEQISEKNRARYQVDQIIRELKKTPTIHKKNPTLAGVLAIVPGGGFLYCGRYRDAFISLLLNGGLIFAAYESFEHEHYALGGVISLVGFGFYAGNIYGSVSSAHKYNRISDGHFIRELKQNIRPAVEIGFIPFPERKSLGIALSYDF